MTTQKFKLAVNNAKFPFLYSRAGRSVVQPGLDVAPRTSVAFVGGAESFDYNMVQMIYAENVLPIAEGISSVGLQDTLLPYTPGVTHFDQFMILRDSVERNFLFSPSRGKNYVWDSATALWVSRNPFTWSSTRNIVSRAYVNGRTITCYEGDRLIEWDPVGNAFTTLTITYPAGYTVASIRGCCGASNYLLLHTDTEILWSSTLDLLNFNDPIGKSGKQTPIDLKGQITCIAPISGGFVVYTNRNAVAAFFTNNPDTPFSFREVQGSGGVASSEQITADANQSEHYTYGSSGLQSLTLQRAVPIQPDCSDFLSSSEYESWNALTGQVEGITLVGALSVKLQFLGSRYLVISYGKINNQFTYALFFDAALSRWGKVRCDHVDIGILPTSVAASLYLRIFELTAPISSYSVAIQDLVSQYAGVLPLRAGFSFLQNTGKIRTLIADSAAALAGGVVVIGHIQVARSKTVTFQALNLEGLYSIPPPTVRVLGSTPSNGYNRTDVYSPALKVSGPTHSRYQGRKTYENFDIAVEGKFNLTTALVETTVNGSR